MSTKIIQFDNGRIFRDNPQEHFMTGYTNHDGIPVRFASIGLYKNNGEEDWVTDPTTKIRQRRIYGQDISFTNGQRSIYFNAVIYKDLIQAIRDCSDCVSHKKTKGVPFVKEGTIIEFEPEVIRKMEEEDTERTFIGINLMSEIRKHQLKGTNEWALIKGIFGLTSPNGDSNNVKKMRDLCVSDLDRVLLSLEIANEEVRVKPEAKNKAILSMALRSKVLVLKDGLYMFHNNSLGSELHQIAFKYSEFLVPIESELVKAGFLKEELKINKTNTEELKINKTNTEEDGE